MESTFAAFSTVTATAAMARRTMAAPSLPLLTISKALHRHFSGARHHLRPLLLARSSPAARRLGFFHASRINSSTNSVCCYRSLGAAVLPVIRRRLQCLSGSSFRSISSGGGGGGSGFGGYNGGGGGGGSNGGDSKAKLVAGVSVPTSDIIILDVRGMTCGGCSASVKKILESQPQVATASVNLTTETAIVWPVPEAKSLPDWQKTLGETLANHLTNCGFESTPRDLVTENFFKVFETKTKDKEARLKQSGRELAVSWALCAVCLVGHLTHFLGVKAPWLHAVHSTGFHVSLCLLTLLGPGRQLILDGFKSLLKGSPNMNTLVGLGAMSSFSVSALAALIPKLGWKTFFEEPVMLIAFVLLGRNLEQRAKIKATSDMTGLLSVLPSKARLLLDGGQNSTVEVPCNSLSVGDLVVILPGDRVPADGIVKSGRSAIDESSFTGEPLPVTKEAGSQVTAGSINLNGTLTVEVHRSGGETAVGDIVRMVEEAQSREAPVQQLVDKVAGRFTYGVMAISAATFTFWNLFGGHILPPALHNGSPLSLALQLSCSVLVVACPCALGLATPTAMLVGTSLGARRGLLLRGGDILEKFSSVDTVVFDKTGTLTKGHPVVTEVIIPEDSRHNLNDTWSEDDVLMLAAAVESNTTHPVGKAIVKAARAHNCQTMKAEDGTFTEEPGSGAVAIVNNKRVAVGTLEWVQRHGATGNLLHASEEHESNNQSVVYIGVDNTLAAVIRFEDKIREDAAQVVENLTRQGIDVYMLSGDKKSAANYVASVVGIPQERVISGVKPAEKKKFINELQMNKNIVAMVGDGINDAAALASSDVGVAMGGGAGAASEVSPVVLMGNRLTQLLDALELSRQTMKTVKQNLWWAFGYNIVGIPIAAGVLLPLTGTMLTPSMAGALMGVSSLGVMTNSLLLRYRFFSNREDKNVKWEPKEGTKQPHENTRWKESS
ncbi:Copper-transporting ATPase PAA1 [Hirschfeldia incana]|nr:Copper-transporting ATPase PAA1 [Hirschfeldia incana]